MGTFGQDPVTSLPSNRLEKEEEEGPAMRDQKPATEGDCIFFLRGKKRMNAKYSFTTRLIRQLRLALRFPPLYLPVSSFPSRETDIEDDGEEGGNFPESLRRRMRPLGAVGETPKRGTFQRGFGVVLLTFLLSSKRRLVRTSPRDRHTSSSSKRGRIPFPRLCFQSLILRNKTGSSNE